MIVVLRKDTSSAEFEQLKRKLQEYGCEFSVYENGEPIVRIRSNQNRLSKDFLLSQPGVEYAFRISSAYPLASRRAEPTVVRGNDWTLDPAHFLIVAGPCAVESEDQILTITQQLAGFGIRFLRGGAYKPRTSPYAFQGLGEDGLKMMRRAADRHAMKVVTEAVSSSDVPLVSEYADVVQIGTRNMQNFRLLKTAGRQKKPVLLKRGMNATIEEFLLAAEYILQEGNPNVILCERGIRTFETASRNTLDIGAVPLVKQMSHLPIIVDPSHASGRRSLIAPLSRAALAAGADGLLVEVHNRAELARSDGPQSIDFTALQDLLKSLRQIAPIVGKEIV